MRMWSIVCAISTDSRNEKHCRSVALERFAAALSPGFAKRDLMPGGANDRKALALLRDTLFETLDGKENYISVKDIDATCGEDPGDESDDEHCAWWQVAHVFEQDPSEDPRVSFLNAVAHVVGEGQAAHSIRGKFMNGISSFWAGVQDKTGGMSDGLQNIVHATGDTASALLHGQLPVQGGILRTLLGPTLINYVVHVGRNCVFGLTALGMLYFLPMSLQRPLLCTVGLAYVTGYESVLVELAWIVGQKPRLAVAVALASVFAPAMISTAAWAWRELQMLFMNQTSRHDFLEDELGRKRIGDLTVDELLRLLAARTDRLHALRGDGEIAPSKMAKAKGKNADKETALDRFRASRCQ